MATVRGTTLLDATGNGIAAHGWYDTGLVVVLTSRIDSELGKGDLARAPAVGPQVFCRFIAEWHA